MRTEINEGDIKLFLKGAHLTSHPIEASCSMAGRLIDLLRDHAGVAAVEFGLIAPAFFLLIVGCAYFGLALFQYTSLTQGVRSGARQLAISVNDSNPYSDTQTAIQTAAPGLNTNLLKITVSINGKPCSTDSVCSNLMADGVAAQVTGTYPCTLTVMGYDFLPSCQFSSSATEMTE
jgi:Flp pilus assembly protein TadG